MKIQVTDRHIEIYRELFNNDLGSITSSTRNALQAVFDSLDIPDPDPNQGWISGRVRLPTREDADVDGDLHVVDRNGDAFHLHYNKLSKDHFWLPFPKNLKHPGTPDAFEVWWKENEKSFPREVSMYQVKAAYELGKQSK